MEDTNWAAVGRARRDTLTWCDQSALRRAAVLSLAPAPVVVVLVVVVVR